MVHRGEGGVHRAPSPSTSRWRAELRHMLGDDVYEQVAKYLDARIAVGRAADAAPGRGAREPRPHADPEAVTEPARRSRTSRREHADLRDEQLRCRRSARASDEWLRPTPARGWDVRDTISHLADTDEMAIDTITRRAPTRSNAVVGALRHRVTTSRSRA